MSPSTHTRRAVLGGGASLVALAAGCLGRPSTGADQSSPIDRETSQTTRTTPPTDVPYDVSVTQATVRPEVVALSSPDSIGVFGDRDEQFLVVTVAAVGDGSPRRDEFSVALDGASVPARGPVDVSSWAGLWPMRDAYQDGPDGYLVFRLPNPVDADAAALEWPGGKTPLDDRVVSALAHPPTTFAVREFSAPDRVEAGTDATATLVVENTGSEDGTFVGALNRTGPRVAYAPETAVSLDVAAGETETWTHLHELPADLRPEAKLVYRLDWRDGDASRTVEIDSPETPTTETAESDTTTTETTAEPAGTTVERA